MPEDKNAWSRLKDHPIVIVVGACVATFATTAAFYRQVIVPYDLKVLEVQVVELTKQLGSMPKSLEEKDSTIEGLRKENASLKQKTFELSKENVFAEDDPYPKSFRHVRIGDPLSKVEETYPGKVQKSDRGYSWVSVNVENDFFFASVTYYFDEHDRPQRVTHVLFIVRNDLEEAVRSSSSKKVLDLSSLEDNKVALTRALKEQLTERYGAGTVAKHQDTEWRVKGLRVTLDDTGALSINKL